MAFPIYWHDGREVRKGDKFKRDPIYQDPHTYKVTGVSTEWVDFKTLDGVGTTRAWGSDFFEPGGRSPRDGRPSNSGIWRRV